MDLPDRPNLDGRSFEKRCSPRGPSRIRPPRQGGSRAAREYTAREGRRHGKAWPPWRACGKGGWHLFSWWLDLFLSFFFSGWLFFRATAAIAAGRSPPRARGGGPRGRVSGRLVQVAPHDSSGVGRGHDGRRTGSYHVELSRDLVPTPAGHAQVNRGEGVYPTDGPSSRVGRNAWRNWGVMNFSSYFCCATRLWPGSGVPVMIPGSTSPEAAMTVPRHPDARQARRLAPWSEV
jgi:hypothetical protein